MIRSNTLIEGIKIPDATGNDDQDNGQEVRERSLADDMAICLRDASMYPELQRITENSRASQTTA